MYSRTMAGDAESNVSSSTSVLTTRQSMRARIHRLWLSIGVLVSCLWLLPAMAAAPVVVPGQSATQLPDGRWLLLGGEGKTAATAALFNAATQQTTPLTSGPLTPRSHHSATLLPDGSVLVFGGYAQDGSVVHSAELLNPTTQSFTSLGDIGLIARAGHTATVMMDGSVLITGGVSDQSTVVAQADLWDSLGRQALGIHAQMVFPRTNHSAQLLANEPVLLSGGRDSAGKTITSDELYWPQQQRFALPDNITTTQLAASGVSAPQVQESLPLANATDVPITARLAVRFSKPMAVTSLNAQSVTLLGPTGSVAVNVVPVESGRMLFVTPQADLRPGARYTLFINAAVDESGAALPFTAIGFTAGSLSGGATPTPSAIGRGSSVGAAPTVASTSTTNSSSPQTAQITSPAPTPGQAATAASAHAAPAQGDDTWIPGPTHLRGDWRIKRPPSPLQQMPPLAAPDGMTALAGQVLLTNGEAAVGVTLKLDNQTTQTNVTGRFLLQGLSAGAKTLIIDGRSINRPGKTYGYFEAMVSLEAGKTNALPYTSWMPRIDTVHSIKFDSPTTSEVVITTPFIPQLEVHIPKGTVLRDRSGRVIHELSITPIPVDRPPFPLPTRYVPVYFTLQPGGAHLEGVDAASAQGARVIYPNYHHDAPGSELDFWNYDPVEKGWYVYGQGKIAANGEQIEPNPGVAIYELTGAMVSLPSNAPAGGPPPGGCHGGSGGSPNSSPAPAAPPNPSGNPDPDCGKNGSPPGPESTPAPGGEGDGGKGAPTAGGCGGDPVDCSTGLFLLTRTDLTVRGSVPISVTHTYRQADSISRAFGIGTSDPYDIFTVGDMNPYTYQDLILPDGGRVHFVRTSAGTSWTDAVYTHTATPSEYYGAVISYVGGKWKLRMRDGRVMYFYDCPGCSSSRGAALREFYDRLGNKLTLTRDANANLTQIANPDGRYINLTYDSSNRVTQATDSIGRTVGYQYDSGGRLAQVTDADGGVEKYAYDTSNNMLTVTKPNGQLMVTNRYDTNNRVSQQTLADGGVYQFAYTLDTNGNVTQTDVTDPRGKVRRAVFNSSGYVTSATNSFGLPEAQTATFERQAGTNLLLSKTDALGRKTAYTYDSIGNITSVTWLAGTSQAVAVSYTYEPTFNQVTSVTDGLGHTTTYSYDSAGNRISVADPLGHTVQFAYNVVGQATSVTDALGNVTTLAYNDGDLFAVTDPLGRTVNRYTDGAGRLLSISDPLGNLTRYDYSGRSLPVKLTDAVGNAITFAYDGNGNLTTLTDARSGQTTFTYDAKDRLASKTDPLSHTVSYGYDGANNLTQVTDRNGKIATFSYDGLSRRTAAAYGQTLVGGTPSSPDATVSYTYDAGNRITQVVDSVGGSVSRSYDSLDRLTSETAPKGSVSYGYDAASRRTNMTVAGQTAVSYAYDNANRLTGITQGGAQVGFTYDAGNRRSSLTLPNGVVASYTYDVAGQLTAINYVNGGTGLGDLSYAYDAGGRRIQMGGTLASMTLPAAVSGAAYDANNRLTSWAGANLTYDANGNLLTDGTLTYAWDSRSRLSALTGGATAGFIYDAVGRRNTKTIGSTTTAFMYDGLNVVQELNASNTVTANLLTGLDVDQTFSRTDTALGARSFVTDALGNTVALTDSTGTVKTSYGYEPYGATMVSGESNTSAAQYTGRENDGTGLYYYRARYYHPGFGRFVSADPIGFGGGPNAYAYAQGNPLRYVDPLGLFIMSTLGGGMNVTLDEAATYGEPGNAAAAAGLATAGAGAAACAFGEGYFGLLTPQTRTIIGIIRGLAKGLHQDAEPPPTPPPPPTLTRPASSNSKPPPPPPGIN
ncbi:RHS repeat-associated core domain-containing protein [Ralstonia sp. NFACC01]|uniref:RHS repeat-associated core domain-containing protein n=1 Tax=Ralstonia sp. NFACC01 TaxID=1566294 RepID=UPI0008E07C61|nr:RHS repeat-associated core domain-containing protein [Ralstonia sp. NFACC01]SFQ19559.1 RHS repeat-associated core domain-containing protein [Ralstonia sp. NFACC01]